MKKHIITISGRPGSGKSTASRNLAARLGYEHFSSGDLFRAISKERGIDIYQANLLAEEEGEIDHLVDQRLIEIGKNQDNVAIDSRLAWHWIPNSFKVYLDLDLKIAAQRIMQNIDTKRIEHEHIPNKSVKYAAILQQRLNSEIRRYEKMYNINPYDLSNYDLVIDASGNNSDQVLEQILTAYEKWIKE